MQSKTLKTLFFGWILACSMIGCSSQVLSSAEEMPSRAKQVKLSQLTQEHAYETFSQPLSRQQVLNKLGSPQGLGRQNHLEYWNYTQMYQTDTGSVLIILSLVFDQNHLVDYELQRHAYKDK